MGLALGFGLLFGQDRDDLVFAWFVQTMVFVIFNKVCTSQVRDVVDLRSQALALNHPVNGDLQYFLWYLLFVPLLVPRLVIPLRRAVLLAACWFGTQALWLSQAYKLEFLGEPVFTRVWICSLIYVIGHTWVLGGIMEGYAA